ncbi:restriction endonuclease subunit S [Clostridium sporogenes]|uniref:restriction endonuclease subunit S n=1 Tax=Clostridium sporogenes TaxID=1509 RepID=UPI00066549B9|nr:restriction endonuclease subunit S [Clostridium sporogenes]
MNGLDATEIKLSNLEKNIRIDSKVYKKIYIKIDEDLKKHEYTLLGDQAEIMKKGIFDIKAECYTDKGIPFVRIGNLKDMIIDDSDIIYIPETENEKNFTTCLKKNDIILSKTAYAAASLVTLEECNTSQDTVAIKLKPNINSYFLVAFLNSKYGYYQMERWFTGNIQMHLNLEDSKNIIIPKLNLIFQKRIELIFKCALKIRNEIRNCYNSAERLLLEELDLNINEFKGKNVAIKSFFSSFGVSGRLDSEYYNPKYDLLKEKIINNAKYVKSIKDIKISNHRGLQPRYSKNGELNVINSKHILKRGLDYENFQKTDLINWDIQSKARVFKEDILTYTTGANIGRTSIYMKEEKALASNHVNILRIRNENPYYIAFVLNSMVGKLQTEKLSVGSAQAELYPKDIDSFIIPFIDQDIQEKIKIKVIEAFGLQNKFDKLLQIEKEAVEKAIEENEDVAMEWIEFQLNKFNIKLEI